MCLWFGERGEVVCIVGPGGGERLARGKINKQLTTQSWSVKTQRGERY